MGRFIAILSSLSLCLLLSCSNNEQNDVTNQPYLSNFSNSGCKQYISGATPATNSPSGKVATTTNDLQDEQIRLLTNDIKDCRSYMKIPFFLAMQLLKLDSKLLDRL